MHMASVRAALPLGRDTLSLGQYFTDVDTFIIPQSASQMSRIRAFVPVILTVVVVRGAVLISDNTVSRLSAASPSSSSASINSNTHTVSTENTVDEMR